MRFTRTFLPSIVLSGVALSALVASLAAQGLPPIPGQGPVSGQVPPLVPPVPSATIQPTQMTITAQQADVYCGPGTNYYATIRLNGGERIVVLGESKRQPGWLEILPPRGSFSWIDARYVKTVPGIDKIGVVDTGDPKTTVPVCPGSNVVGAQRNVESARVSHGTQVVLLNNQPTPDNGTNWYPIAPAVSEVRYIPADAVRGGVYASNGYGQNPYGQNTYGGNPYQPTGYQNSGYQGQPNPAAAAGAYPFIALAQQGDQAYSAGNMTRAYQLYSEALTQTNDAAWQQYLRGQIAKLSPQSPQSGPPALPNSNWSPTVPTGLPGAGTSPPVAVPGQKQWTSWGVLRSTTFTHEGQPMYVLESLENSSTPFYVTTRNGTSLAGLVGQTVALYGTIDYRSEPAIRMTYMIAEQVATPPNGATPTGR
jgi:hypothetical protein